MSRPHERLGSLAFSLLLLSDLEAAPHHSMRLVALSFALALAAPAFLVSAGCGGPPRHRHEVYVEHAPPPGPEVIVVEEPPPPRLEAIPRPPAANYVWVPGYWARHGNSWVWVEGAHVVRPRAGVVWVPGQWARRPNGWVWVPGHWS